MDIKSLDELDPGFCNWFAGLVDGEGSLQLKYKKRVWWLELTIKLRDDDLPMLKMIQKELGRGRLYSSSSGGGLNSYPQYMFRLHSATDIRFIIALLKRYPLRSKKKQVFDLWTQASEELGKPPSARSRKYLRYLEQAIRQVRRYGEQSIKSYEAEGIQGTLAIERTMDKDSKSMMQKEVA